MIEPLGINMIEKTCRAVFRPELESAGFEYVKPMHWVRQTKRPVREVFYFKAGEDGQFLLPHWGFSLDFVPHITPHGTTWYRTQESARITDLLGSSYEKLPKPEQRDWMVHYYCSPKEIKVNFEKNKEILLPEINAFFNRVKSSDDLEATYRWDFDQQERDPRPDFDPTDQILAFAFVLAQNGNKAEAREYFDKFVAARQEGVELLPSALAPFQKLKALFVKEISSGAA